MANVIQIKRSAGSTAPTELLVGELAYVEGTNKLYIGNGANVTAEHEGDVVEVKPDFLTYAAAGSSDVISLADSNSSHSYSFDTGALGGNVTYTLPATLPGETRILTSTTDGQLGYGTVSIDELEAIPGVEPTPAENEILVYNGTTWVGTAPSATTTAMGLDNGDSQEYTNLTINGDLIVNGNSLTLNTTDLQIKDNTMGIGVSGTTVIIQNTTIVSGVISFGAGSGFSDNDVVFVGDGNSNIPSKFYTVSVSGGIASITLDDTNVNVGTQFNLAVSEQSDNATIDGAGLSFPGETEKSLKWNDSDDNFSLTGGDLKVASNVVTVDSVDVINDSTKVISADVATTQITGIFDGGSYN